MPSIRRLGLGSLLLVGACAARAEWRELTTPSLTLEEVWTTFSEKAALNGYLPKTSGPEPTDRGLREFHSRWITREYGFRNTLRRRLHAHFERSRTDPSAWTIRFRVERQQVTDIGKSMNPEEDDWKDDGQDRDVEERIAAQIRLELGMAVETKRSPQK